MRASTQISVIMTALAKIRGEQRFLLEYVCPTSLSTVIYGAKRTHFLKAPPMLYYRKAGVLPAAPGCFRNDLFFLDATLVNAQELRMPLVCSKASKFPQINIYMNIDNHIAINKLIITTTNIKHY